MCKSNYGCSTVGISLSNGRISSLISPTRIAAWLRLTCSRGICPLKTPQCCRNVPEKACLRTRHYITYTNNAFFETKVPSLSFHAFKVVFFFRLHPTCSLRCLIQSVWISEFFHLPKNWIVQCAGLSRARRLQISDSCRPNAIGSHAIFGLSKILSNSARYWCVA